MPDFVKRRFVWFAVLGPQFPVGQRARGWWQILQLRNIAVIEMPST